MKEKTLKKTKWKKGTNNLKGSPHPFSKTNQPSPAAKSAGRDRRRESQRIMAEMMKYQDMTVEEFNEYLEKNKDNLKIGSVMTSNRQKNILWNPGMLLDWVNRHVSKAPTEITGQDWEPLFDKSMKERTAEEVMEYYLTNIKNKK